MKIIEVQSKGGKIMLAFQQCSYMSDIYLSILSLEFEINIVDLRPREIKISLSR